MCLEKLQVSQPEKKLNLKESDHLLEIGTGWGGFAIYAAKNYGCKITSTTISKEQHQMAKLRVDEEGLSSKINLLLEDYRDLSGQFDKLVSIEMIEAVGYQFYSDYFKKCSSLLKADGLMVLQAITIADQQYKKSIKSVDFIQKYIFPGGYTPSLSEIARPIEDSNLILNDLEVLRLHYAYTLKNWRERFLNKKDKVLEMFDERFLRMWEFYFAGCEMAFKWGDQVVFQLQLTNALYIRKRRVCAQTHGPWAPCGN